MKLWIALKQVKNEEKLKDMYLSGKIDTALSYYELFEGLSKKRKGLPPIFAIYDDANIENLKLSKEIYNYLKTVSFDTLFLAYTKNFLQDEIRTELMFRVAQNPNLVLKITDKELQSVILAEAGSFSIENGYTGVLEQLTELQDLIDPPEAEYLSSSVFDNMEFSRWYFEWIDYKAPEDIKYLVSINNDVIYMTDDIQPKIIQILANYYAPEAIMRVFFSGWTNESLAKATIAAVFDSVSMQDFFETLYSIAEDNNYVQTEAITDYYFEFRNYNDV